MIDVSPNRKTITKATNVEMIMFEIPTYPNFMN